MKFSSWFLPIAFIVFFTSQAQETQTVENLVIVTESVAQKVELIPNEGFTDT